MSRRIVSSRPTGDIVLRVNNDERRLPLEKFVSERIGVDDIEDAFHKMHTGEVLRSVVMLK